MEQNVKKGNRRITGFILQSFMASSILGASAPAWAIAQMETSGPPANIVPAVAPGENSPSPVTLPAGTALPLSSGNENPIAPPDKAGPTSLLSGRPRTKKSIAALNAAGVTAMLLNISQNHSIVILGPTERPNYIQRLVDIGGVPSPMRRDLQAYRYTRVGDVAGGGIKFKVEGLFFAKRDSESIMIGTFVLEPGNALTFPQSLALPPGQTLRMPNGDRALRMNHIRLHRAGNDSQPIPDGFLKRRDVPLPGYNVLRDVRPEEQVSLQSQDPASAWGDFIGQLQKLDPESKQKLGNFLYGIAGEQTSESIPPNQSEK